jgi:hypothetical protein
MTKAAALPLIDEVLPEKPLRQSVVVIASIEDTTRLTKGVCPAYPLALAAAEPLPPLRVSPAKSGAPWTTWRTMVKQVLTAAPKSGYRAGMCLCVADR